MSADPAPVATPEVAAAPPPPPPASAPPVSLWAIEPTPPGDVQEKVRAAREAQLAWSALSLRARVRALRKVKRRLLANADVLAEAVVDETGKPVEEALLADVVPNADVVDYWASVADDLFEPEEIELDSLAYRSKRGRTTRLPRGVIALITPANYPVAIPFRTIVPALLAGNGIVFKPSESTPRTGAMLASFFEGIVPPGLVSVAQGGREVGEALIAAGVDAVVFTGSVATGRAVAEACAHRLTPCSLELGGKDAAVVLADADLERAARGVVWAGLTNSGQNCASVERVYVERAVYEGFSRRVVELVRQLRPGIDLGRMTTSAGLELVRGQVERAVSDGNEILTGGAVDGAEGGRTFAPTVIRVQNERTALMTEETFGPVLPLVAVADLDEAVERVNASRFGLTVSVWTKHPARAEKLAAKLRAGVVTINNHAFTGALPAAPWGGVGESGDGIANSPHALSILTRPQFVLVDRSRAKRELWWYPYTPTLRVLARAMAVVRGGGGLFARLKALVTLARTLPARLFGSG